MSDALTIDYIEAQVPAVADEEHLPASHDASGFRSVDWGQLERDAELISTCPGLAPEFSDPRNCRFVAYQAQRWGTDPVMTALKTYFTPRKGDKGLLVGYEAQLIHALIEGDPMLLEPLELTYGYSDPSKKTAQFRFLKVSGKLRGASKASVLTTPTVSQIKVKNSPLWFSDPDQQLAYYGVRAWARRYRPSRILGVYSRDEMQFSGEALESRSQPFDDPTDADFGDAIPPETTRDGTERRDEPPPATGDNAADGMGEIKTWAEAERARIVALTDLDAITVQGNALKTAPNFKRLLAYDQSDARRIMRSIANRIDELKAG